jgi:hypothetical protein
MNPWQTANQESDGKRKCNGALVDFEHPDARLLSIDASLRRARHELDGGHHEAHMRCDLRILALAGFIPERGYRKESAFRDAVELMRELAQNTK